MTVRNRRSARSFASSISGIYEPAACESGVEIARIPRTQLHVPRKVSAGELVDGSHDGVGGDITCGAHHPVDTT